MTEREATDSLLSAVKAALSLLRIGLPQEAVTVLKAAREKAIDGLGITEADR